MTDDDIRTNAHFMNDRGYSHTQGLSPQKVYLFRVKPACVIFAEAALCDEDFALKSLCIGAWKHSGFPFREMISFVETIQRPKWKKIPCQLKFISKWVIFEE